MALNVSYIFSAIDKFSSTAAKVKASMQGVEEKAQSVNRSIRAMGKGAGDLGRKFLPVSGAVGGVGLMAVATSARMEQLQTSFETMTGSAENAKRMVGDLRTFAASTPFQLDGIGQAAKQLMAFGVEQDDIVNKLTMLGDIAAGSGSSLQDMAAIFGKAKAKGKVMTEELLQLSDRGIPIIDTLAKGFGVTKDQVFEMASKSQISFDAMTQAMQVMTAEGQIFGGQMAKQSETTAGIFSTLKDNIADALATIGDTLVETFQIKEMMKGAIQGVKDFTTGFKAFVQNNPKLAKFLAILAAIVVALAPLLIFLGAIAPVVGLLVSGFGLLAGVFTAMSLPVIAIIAAVAALVAAVWWLNSNWTEVSNAIGGTIEQIGINFMAMVDSIKNAFSQVASFATTLFKASPLGKLVSLASGLFSSANAQIDVNINDKGGNVESVKSDSDSGGFFGFNVGLNMG